jgi:predicted nucleic acid-binding Zn ribbon protein
MNDTTLPICPQCGKSNMHRGPGGGTAVHFKGTGFYETDYKDK